ncbi:MAG: protein kinase [Planctomycetota bacterium]
MTAPPGYDLGPAYAEDATGVFYKAVQVSLARPVTVKMLREGTAKDDPAFAHFVKEIAVVTSLEHANLLLAVDSGAMRGMPYLVTESTIEPTLLKALRDREPLAEPRAVRIALGIAHAIRHLESKHFIYKNLNAKHVLLPRPAAPKLTTFRLVKPISEAAVFRRSNVQSANYCAPELVRDDLGPVTNRANVYALGALLYHMLSGLPPADGLEGDVRELHADGEIPPLKTLRPYLRDRAHTVVGKLMARDPAARPDPGTAVALLEAYANDPLLNKSITKKKRRRRRRR